MFLRIFVGIFIMSINIYGILPVNGYLSLRGYKNIAFGMDTNTVHNLVTKSVNTTKHKVSAEFIEAFSLREGNDALKYYDQQFKIIYIFFFEKNQLYRVDIASHSGASYEDLSIEHAVTPSYIVNLIDTVNVEYGAVTMYDREYRSYLGKDFDIDTYLWQSPLTSVSLIVKPTIGSFDKIVKYYTYRLTYYNDMLLKSISNVD